VPGRTVATGEETQKDPEFNQRLATARSRLKRTLVLAEKTQLLASRKGGKSPQISLSRKTSKPVLKESAGRWGRVVPRRRTGGIQNIFPNCYTWKRFDEGFAKSAQAEIDPGRFLPMGGDLCYNGRRRALSVLPQEDFPQRRGDCRKKKSRNWIHEIQSNTL